MDELSHRARSLLAAAEMSEEPTAEDAARVRRAVLTHVGALGLTAAVVTAGSTQAKAASLVSIAVKLTAALAVTAGTVAAAWTYVSHRDELAVSAPAAVTRSAPVAAPARSDSAAPSESVSPPREAPTREPAPAVRSPRSPVRPPRLADKPQPALAPVKVAPGPADLDAEMRLIRGADSALRAGRTTEALALLAQHQADHPQASLAHEREGLRAIANCQLGAPASTAVAERFLARTPRSPLAPRLRSACRIGD
ncbi:MAG: hypothetical protein EOO73_01070 [Myxococcales bacterium]|nr:MAG: hypothetical protein EOO73_01070 [Myxococcales bacterium]